MIKLLTRIAILSIFTIAIQSVSFGGIKQWTNSINTPSGGADVEIGTPTALDTVEADFTLLNHVDARVLNRLTLGVDIHYSDYLNSALDLTVQVLVKRWDFAMNPMLDTIVTLKIAYHAFDTQQSIIEGVEEFNNAYKIIFEIISITSTSPTTQQLTILPANLYLQCDIFIERYIELIDVNASTNGMSQNIGLRDKDCDSITDGLAFYWANIPGAEEYQVEWLYINDYGFDPNTPYSPTSTPMSETDLEYSFKYNSTRITTSDILYSINLIYDKGWIIYRIRPVGVDINNPTQLIYGSWSEPVSGTIDVINTNSKFHITDFLRHEQEINWQYSATYAEQGKKKEIVSYYDGSLRNRQTVTRINSDKNVIVGETIYDYQGRPVINVLPTPVVPNCDGPFLEPTLHLYRDYNLNLNNEQYSKSDFDISASGAECDIIASGMSTSNGSSQYYSSNNPNQINEQAYVPDAKKFPFTQVEYTPDNTGRIRRQGGVGEEFQLGSGHETQYLYGQPNQLELDRVFGSEMGDVSHYKKNVVIDAHGQASISYLDQEGRVIATSLAGDAPDNLAGLQSEAQNPVLLSVDAFGGANSNTISVDQNAIEFSTQLLVAYQSTYNFQYDFAIDPLELECLGDLCVDCVYDLKIELVDECGINLAPAELEDIMVGKFIDDGNGNYTFHSSCSENLQQTVIPGFVASLEPGYYSLNKILTINNDARQVFLDSVLNSDCSYDLEYFIDQAMENIDTSGCEITCDDCFTDLGSLEDYIANGEGTANDYYLRIEDCERLCENDMNFCEIELSLLRMDVSPGGQYGTLNNTNPLTVYLSTSLLNPVNGQAAFWRNPQLPTPYGIQEIYTDANGDSSKIFLTLDLVTPSLWSPAPINNNLVKTDIATGNPYIYPHELGNIQGFMDLFEQSWAKSLVVYHPEYCYYETCIKYESEIVAGDAFTSTSFDDLLTNTSTVQDAIDNGFLSSTNPSNLENWFDNQGSNTYTGNAWDPFVVYNPNWNSTLCSNYGAALEFQFNNYKEIGGIMRSMKEVAAYMARCGTNFYNTPPVSCFDFGGLYNSVVDNQVLENEWNFLKSFYISAKQELKRQFADCIAVNECNAFNECIGNDNFNYWSSQLNAPNLGGFLNNQIFNADQPCSIFTAHWYKNKIRRFSNEDAIPMQNINDVAYEMYLQTGQCPVPFTLQSLLSSLATESELVSSNYTLNSNPNLFSLFQANNNYANFGTIPTLIQNVTINTSSYSAVWSDNGSPYATLTMNLGNNTILWSDVVQIVNLYPGASSGTFTAEAITIDGSGNQVLTPITGTITTFDLSDCTFEQNCTSNQFAIDLSMILNSMTNAGSLLSTSAVAINPFVNNSSTLTGLVTPYVENAVGFGSNLYWISNGVDGFQLIPLNGAANEGFYLNFDTYLPNTYSWSDLSNVVYFDNITSTGGSSFELVAYLQNGDSFSITGTAHRIENSILTGVQLGECDYPTPIACQTIQHEVFTDLENLLYDVLITQDYNGNSIDLYQSIAFTPTLSSEFSYTAINSTSSESINNDSLIITVDDCDIVLSLPIGSTVTFSDLINFTDFQVTGNVNNFGAFNDFQFNGLFDNNGIIKNIVVTGSSCLAVKECDPCGQEAFIANNAGNSNDPNPPVNCEDAYPQYTYCLNEFNSTFGGIVGVGGWFHPVSVIDSGQFFTNNYCNCVDAFCERLNSLLTGAYVVNDQAELEAYIDLQTICTELQPLPCEPRQDTGSFTLSPDIELVNDCIQMMINQALLEAQNNFQTYVDSVSNASLTMYNEHCLGVTENFTYDYLDKLYHYTLYYYDQAGNLTKTIPPAGVEIVPITASSDPISLQIESDRLNGTRTVFTTHRLPTDYEYNSLNQLVAQSSPDTDPMEVFDLSLSTGLADELVVYKIQMVTPSQGYLAGKLGERGYYYKTNDGGASWIRVYNLLGANLKKVSMLNANFGVAIGEKGNIIRTTDGGDSWDLIETWNTNTASAGMIKDLNDISFVETSPNNFTVIIVGEDNLVVKSTNVNSLTPSFSVLSNGITEPANSSITSITNDGTNFFLTINNSITNTATIYTMPITGNSWTLDNNFSAGSLADVELYNSTGAYMAGDDGRLYKNSKAFKPTQRWDLVHTDLVEPIRAIQFFDVNEGVALVEILGANRLMKTINGGKNWSLISDGIFNHLSQSDDNTLILAVGQDSRMEIVVASNNISTPSIIVNITSLNLNITSAWIDKETVAPGSNAHILIATDNQRMYFTPNAFQPNPAWQQADLTATLGSDIIVDLAINRATNPVLNGIALTSSGSLLEVSKTSFANLVTLNSILNTNANAYSSISKDLNKVYAYDNTTNSLGFVNIGTNSLMTITPPSTVQANLSSFIVSGNNIVGLSGAGQIVHSTIVGTTLQVENDNTLKINPLPLFDIDYQPTNQLLLAAGSDGELYQRNIGASSWERVNTSINENINALEEFNSNTLIVGQNGLSKTGQITSLAYSSIDLATNLSTVQNELSNDDLFDVLSYSNRIYLVGQNGKIAYKGPGIGAPFTVTTQGSENIYSIAQIPGATKAVSVGRNGQVHNNVGASFLANRKVFLPSLIDVHYSDMNNGTIIADRFTIRTTNDGGINWNIVTPTTPQAPISSMRATWTKNNNRSFVFGDAQFEIINQIATPILPTVTQVSAVDAGLDINNLYLANTDEVLQVTIDGSNTITTTTSIGASEIANAIHVFNDGSFAITGENSLFKTFSSTGSPIITSSGISPAKNFNALFFHDNINGVLVGDDGAYYKTTDQTQTAIGNLTGTNWIEKTAIYTADPYFVTQANQVNIYTVAFSSPNDGLIGGEYTGSFPIAALSLSQPYMRRLYDANSRYSAKFYYDKLGRLIVSQNARQYNGTFRKFSYTLYDFLGRVIEVGEKTENAGPNELRFKDVFGTVISNYLNPNAIDDAKLQTWVTGSGPRKEVTKSYYDFPLPVAGLPVDFVADLSTQRKRILHVTYEEVFDGNDLTYSHATHYKYDIHGNVTTLIQDNQKMVNTYSTLANQQIKRMDYVYDLVSGNVHRMSVQKGEDDQWHHAYTYDADNRITNAYTSTQTPLIGNTQFAQTMENELIGNSDWENDAHYIYYDHGPLARTEIGENELQGVDYIYNLQGWLKGIDATSLDKQIDPGKDGVVNTVNAPFADDVMAFSLHYFQNDYQAINGTGQNHAATIGGQLTANSNDLYNGNIKVMQTTLTNPTTRDAMPMANAYQYDQLNRLLESRSFETGYANNAWNPTIYNSEYFNKFEYDAMGNILTQKRHARDGTLWEDLTYNYDYLDPGTNTQLLRNRLFTVNDAVGEVDPLASDLGDQSPFLSDVADIDINNNYRYDAEGRLKQDVAENIEDIIWRVDGKVKEIVRISGSSTKNVIFDYDAMGNRIAKHVYDNSTGEFDKSTYYILDAQGNTISTYDHEIVASDAIYNLKERHIYGSSRLGVTTEEVRLEGPVVLDTGITGTPLGLRYYELSNHLGNVLTVINDEVMPLSSNGTTVDSYQVGIVSATDYSPFGVQLDGRTISNGDYRYGFQGQEKDDEIKGEGNSVNYEYRMHDPRVGRFFARDPLAPQYPYNSPYAFAENRVNDGRELEGLEWEQSTTYYSDGWTVTDFTVKLKVKNSSSILTDAEALALAKQSIPGIEKAYNKEFSDRKTAFTIKVKLTMDNGAKEGTDFYFNVIDGKSEGGSYTAGEATGGIGEPVVNKINLTGTLDGQKLTAPKRTAAHELGHTGGLEHPHKPHGGGLNPITEQQYKNGQINDNLMIWGSKGGRGYGVTWEQFQTIVGEISSHDKYTITEPVSNPLDNGAVKRDATYVNNPYKETSRKVTKSHGRSKTQTSTAKYK